MTILPDKKHSLVFFGTPKFAVPSLSALIKANYNIIGVVSAPPKPAGRHSDLIKSPIQQVAEKYKLPLRTPNNLKDANFTDWLKKLNPEVAVVVAYGKILPQALLDVPSRGFVNIHPSLLPRHRGPAPIVHTILAGDSLMGVSLMVLDKKMDHGPIIAQKSWPLSQQATTAELTPQLARAGAELLTDNLSAYLTGKILPRAQDDKKATTHHLLKREDGEIDWDKSAEHILRTIRAYDPWPGIYSCLDGKRLKIFEIVATQVPHTSNAQVGQLISEGRQLLVETGSKLLEIKVLQLAGHKKQTAPEFINGHPDLNGTILERCHTGKPLP